ncbi:MAG: cupin domain-containing protein [Flavobacteriaceae bacterium]
MKKLLIIPIAILILSCTNIDKKTKTEHNLSSKIEYLDKVNNKIYFESDAYKMILFAMKKEHILKPHSAPMDTPLLILEGQAKITIDDKEYVLRPNESIVLPKNMLHGVYPITNVKFVLIK